VAQAYADYSDFARAVEALTARLVADRVRVAQQYRDLMERVAAGEVDAASLRAEYDRLVAEQSGQLARDLSDLGVRYYESMLNLHRAYVDRLFDHLAAPTRTVSTNDQAPPAPPPTPSIVELHLAGRMGYSVEAAFSIENKREDPADVFFLLSDFTSAGVEPFRPFLELDPPRLLLEPHEERDVTVRVALDPDRFEAGRRYFAQVLVRGTEELELRLVLDVGD
jgi:hypothetical protein